VQDEYGHVFLSPQAIDSSTVTRRTSYIFLTIRCKKCAPSSVAAGSAHHSQRVWSFPGRFARISPGEEKLKEIAQELQRHVLERESGAMEELQDELVIVQFRQGRDVGMPESGVGSAHECAQLFARELVRSDVEGEYGHGKIDKGVGIPVVLPVGG
jgi:hypothetical protein